MFPTIRNAKGANMYVIDKNDKKRAVPIQVKALSKRMDVPFGAPAERYEEYVFLVVGVREGSPDLYFAPMDRVRGDCDVQKSRKRGGRPGMWLPRKKWEGYNQDLEGFLEPAGAPRTNMLGADGRGRAPAKRPAKTAAQNL